VTLPHGAARFAIEAADRRRSRPQRADRLERLGRAAPEALIALDSALSGDGRTSVGAAGRG